MKKLVLTGFLLLIFPSVLNCNFKNDCNNGVFIYLINGEGKISNYVKNYNLDKTGNYSHIAIVFVNNCYFESFEVLPLQSSHCIVRRNKLDFMNIYEDDIAEIWKIRSLNPLQEKKI
jgi:hypothetical protein